MYTILDIKGKYFPFVFNRIQIDSTKKTKQSLSKKLLFQLGEKKENPTFDHQRVVL